MEYEFRPLQQWPGKPTTNRKAAVFRASYSATIKLLEKELRALSARNVVIQADCDPSQIRIDGMLRADAKMRGPGIILSFNSQHGPLMYPCDRFTHFDDNLRAIALALAALRTVDRYGVTKRGEQYRGWNALPEPGKPFASREEAVKFLCHLAGYRPEVFDSGHRDSVLKRAAKAAHPDSGGSHETFIRMTQAIEMATATR